MIRPDPQKKDKKSTPKFASFKLPSATDTAESSDRPQSNSERDHKPRSSRRSDGNHHERVSDRPSRSSHSSSNRHRSRQHSRHRSRERSRSPRVTSRHHRSRERDLRRRSIQSSANKDSLLLPEPSQTTPIKSTWPQWASQVSTAEDSYSDSSPEFFIDSRGDQDALAYGTGNRWKVPYYHRFGGGFVLGLGRTYRIDRDQSHGEHVVLRPSWVADSSTRDGDNHLLSQARSLPFPEYRVGGSAASGLELTADFVMIDGQDWGEPCPRPVHNTDLQEEIADFERLLISTWPPATRDIEHPTEGIDLDAERKSRNATLWKAVEDNPQDVGAWLRFIDYQDMSILGPRDDSYCLTHDERTSLADVKLSLYDKALKQASESPHKDRLLLGRLQIGAQLWDSEKVSNQWEKTLQDNPEFISLWVKFLNFCQTDSPDFTFGQCIATHEKYLRLVSSLIPLRPNMVQVLVYIFLRFTILFREAGFSEIAVGLWQAVLEFCCFKPEFDNTNEILSSFRDFWDSEVPRIGEDGAKGWRNNTASDPDPTTTQYSSNVCNSDVASWVEAERERMTKSQLPWRSLDGSIPDADDPNKVPLFCDIEHILPLFMSLTQSDELIDAFLYFGQLPHLTFPSNIQTTRVWGWDNLLRTEFVADHRLGLSSWMPPHDENQKPAKPFLYPLQNFLNTTDTLFASPNHWFYSFQWWGKSHSIQPPLKTHEWTLRSLRLLVDQHPDDEELAEYALALEFACDPVMGRKIAKKTVKKRPSSLRLWNALAIMESRSEDTEGRKKANGVWATALSMSLDFTKTEQKTDRAILWQSWIWQFMERGEQTQALYLLHNIAEARIDPEQIPNEETFFTPTSTVKVQKFLRECQEQALIARRAQAYVAYTDCLALIYYLSNWPFEAVLDIYDSAVLKLKGLSPDREAFKAFTAELLHQARARVVYDSLCQKDHHYTPMQVRELFRESITLFPHNTIFQSICMWNEFSIIQIDRLRDLHKFVKEDMDSQYQLDASPVIPPQRVPISSYLLPIWIQLASPRSTGPSYWIVRPVFEKALGEVLDPAEFRTGGVAVRSRFGVDSARSNLTIWKLYMLYERYHAKDLDAAKAVFYRAIRACPWSKELVMFAFEHLRDGMPVSPGEVTLKGDGLNADELRRLVLVLGERQLRLHLDIRADIIRAADESHAS
ncbi:hypothetical protein N7520_004117 [Penicillium odoratum]|uniref:uncharacterized protein n=1 Tax=Penicillium odoratum TaxID=1167516 RepID=UPI0025492D53|nr:uncharacterized protein N7520_004117 [Penicillium odoratum]KAJ5769558.1 hypothetical protein N7520_004117 [Penicillium odoratum]